MAWLENQSIFFAANFGIQDQKPNWQSNSRAPMPSKPNSSVAAKPVCNVETVSREWKALPGVRHVAVQRDRLFESHIQGESQEKVVKDAVHNQQMSGT